MDGLQAAAMEAGGTSHDVFTDWPQDAPRLRQDRHGPAHRQAATSRGTPPTSPAAAGAARSSSRSTVEECGCFGAEAAAPIARLILSQHFGVEKKFVRGESSTR